MNETDYNARLYEKMKADWQEDGVKVSKGAKSLSILEPVEYAKHKTLIASAKRYCGTKHGTIRTRWQGKETERSIFLSCPSKCWNSSLSVIPISRIAAHLKSSAIRFVSMMKRWRKQSPLCLLTAEILSCCLTFSICPTLKLQMC